MKVKIDLDGHGTLELQANEGRITFNGQQVRGQTMQVLGEAVHHVRVAADIQAAAIRRAERDRAEHEELEAAQS